MDLQPGQPRVLRADPAAIAPGWAAAHREALRAAVAEHGCVLVRGLGLRDAAETGAVFRQLTSGLMTEKEAFASRQAYPGGLYSSSKWPPNQQMCMHHELSYALEFPGLMLFACLRAPPQRRGDRRGRLTDRARRPAGRADRAVRAGGLAADPQLQRGLRGFPRARRSAPMTAAPSRLLPRQRDRIRVAARRRAAHQAAPQRGGTSPADRSALLVQPGRVPQQQTIDPEVREYLVDLYGADGLPFNTQFRQRRPDRRGRRPAAQRDLRGPHRP